jgi:hypothetical protein
MFSDETEPPSPIDCLELNWISFPPDEVLPIIPLPIPAGAGSEELKGLFSFASDGAALLLILFELFLN